jgi:DNA-binding CsgD family transcriptional regulator
VKRLLCPVLIGRDAEMAELRDALGAAAAGDLGSTLFLVGEAGVGKTRLAREAVAEARTLGFNVLRGRAAHARDIVAFRPLAEALFSYFRDEGPPELPELDPFRPTLGRLVPEWRTPGVEPPDDSIVVLAEAILRLLRVVGRRRGCLLFLDDLHWADPDTLAIVEYLAQNISSERIVCLGALRPDEGPAARGLVDALVAQRAASEIDLANLDTRDVAAMARACLAAERLPAAVEALVADHAEGLPFLVEELLAGAADSGALVEQGDSWTATGPVLPDLPRTLVDSVDARLARLGDHARVLVTASVLGRQFDWRLLPGMTGLEELVVLEALRAGVDAQLLVTEPSVASAFRFRHALTRDAVVRRLLPAERQLLSRRALEVVEAAHPGLPDEWCDLAAHLAEVAGEPGSAADLLVRSGHHSLVLGALASAEDTFERARRLADRPTVAADAADGLCETLALAGNSEAALTVGAELLALLATLHAPTQRVGAVHLRLARAALLGSHTEAAEQHLEQARMCAADGDLVPLAARVDAIDARVASGRGAHNRARELGERALRAAEQLDLPDVQCEALEELGRIARASDAEEAERAFEAALRIAEEHDLVVWRIRALFELSTIDLLLMRSDDRMIATRDLAMSSGALATAAQIDLHLAHWHVDHFDLVRSIEAARRSSDVARRFRMGDLLANGLVAEATACGRLGRGKEMEALLREAVAITDDPSLATIISGHCRAMASLVAENQRRALHELDTATDILRRHPSTVFYPERGLWALLRAVHGNDGEAACAEVRASGAILSRMIRGYVHLAEAVLLGRAGRVDDAQEAFAAGDGELEPVNWLRQHARRLAAEAAINDGWGDPITWLRQALVVFEDHHQERLTAACRSLLRKAGAPVPRRGADSGIPPALREIGVTARELEVLTLLADGLSNREISSRLYFSPRTVERHIANLTAKAGLRTRSELVAFAARSVAE